MKKENKTYYVVVTYPATWYFSDINQKFKLDKTIEKLNSKANSGGGMGSGKRDISFCDLSRKGADKLMKQARKIKKGITARLYLQDECFY